MEPRKAAEASSLSRIFARGVIQYCTERLHNTLARMKGSTFWHHCLAFSPLSNSSRFHKELRQLGNPGFSYEPLSADLHSWESAGVT